MKARLLFPAAIVLIGVVSILASAKEDSNGAQQVNVPDLSDKVLLVYTSREPRYPTWIMAESRLHQIGDRFFLSGKYADTRRSEDWRSGFETHVAWDVVTTYQVLTTKEFEKFLDAAQAAR